MRKTKTKTLCARRERCKQKQNARTQRRKALSPAQTVWGEMWNRFFAFDAFRCSLRFGCCFPSSSSSTVIFSLPLWCCLAELSWRWIFVVFLLPSHLSHLLVGDAITRHQTKDVWFEGREGRCICFASKTIRPDAGLECAWSRLNKTAGRSVDQQQLCARSRATRA